MRIGRNLGLLLAVAGCVAASAAVFAADFDEDDEVKKWQEAEISLPPMPKQQDLVPFFVSATTDNRFFIDPASVSVGADGVVRYTLVVTSASGAKNVSYEGMRCATRERRLYAFGRSDGTWSKSRNGQWERVKEGGSNRHHAALFQEYFCPDGVIVRDAEEAKGALQRGHHTSAERWGA